MRPNEPDEVVIPLAEESIDVATRRIETGRVRVTTAVRTEEQVVDPALLREAVEIERVAVNRVVDAATGPRQEGDTLVIPLFEEVVVVEKRLVLTEEVRITRRQTEAHQPQTVTLRREEARVERVETENETGR